MRLGRFSTLKNANKSLIPFSSRASSLVAFRFRAISQSLDLGGRFISRHRRHRNRLHFCVSRYPAFTRSRLSMPTRARANPLELARANVCRERKEIRAALSRTGTRRVYYSANMARICARLDALRSRSWYAGELSFLQSAIATAI